jgi:SAM-dependent methyltransferase
VLDVGCGEGLLLERLVPFARTVTGIDPDQASIQRAAARLKGSDNTRLVSGDFITTDFSGAEFDLICFVASLHHMDSRKALEKAKSLLRPGGRIIVIGIAASSTIADITVDVLRTPVVRLSGLFHRETQDVGVPVRDAIESLTVVRGIAADVLPGSRIERGLYYRYLLEWTKPLG